MPTPDSRVEPSPAVLEAARSWLAPVRAALGPEFHSAYLTGSVLTQGFDPAHSRVNVFVVARSLAPVVLDRLVDAIPETKKAPHFEPLFMTKEQIEDSLDVFPIEWLDLSASHLALEGEDVFAGIEVPRGSLRLQCEHELRGKHVALRQAFLAGGRHPERLRETLVRLASGFHTLFRTLLRLRGEEPPANHERVVERIAEAFGLDAKALQGAHRVRYASARPSAEEVRETFRRFLVEIERLVGAIDTLRVP